MSRYIDAEKIKFEPIDITVKGITRRTVERMATETEIDAMPTADVEEVRHGEWIFFRGYITCSSCKAQPYREHRHIDFDNLYKRCPECGAHMRREQ